MKPLVTILSSFLLLLSSCTTQPTKNKGNSMIEQSHFILNETKDNIEYLVSIYRDDRIIYGNLPYTGKGDFFIHFEVNSCSKINKFSSTMTYTMHVTPSENGYATTLRLESDTFYEDGQNVGHAEPSGEWLDNPELCHKVLDYYFDNKSIIPVFTSEGVDVSQWKPLFALSKNESYQQHVIKLTKRELGYGQFYIDCELLGVNNMLVNGELQSYSISTHTLHFTPTGERYYVRMKHNSTKTYTNGGKDVVDLKVSGIEEEDRYADEILFSNKVLEYYFAHKSDIQTTSSGESK